MAKLSDLKSMLDAAGVTPKLHGTPRPTGAAPREAAAAPPVRESVRQHIARSKHAEGDIDLSRAFEDVQRLAPPNKARIERERPPPVPTQRLEDERDALEMSKYGAEPAPHTWDIGQEHEADLTFLRPGLGTDILSKLRRGRWSVQGELDLHGLNTDESRDALADFLLEARTRGLRCVRVIHGKGLTSPNKEPVLKGKVRKWLAHWDDVLAYCEAPRHAGGGGAVLILLRGSERR